MARDGIGNILNNLPAEKPMRQTAFYALHNTAMRVNGINGTNTPTLIVAILAIIQAYLPPLSICPPPFTGKVRSHFTYGLFCFVLRVELGVKDGSKEGDELGIAFACALERVDRCLRVGVRTACVGELGLVACAETGE